MVAHQPKEGQPPKESVLKTLAEVSLILRIIVLPPTHLNPNLNLNSNPNLNPKLNRNLN